MEDYSNCNRNVPKETLSASSSEKSLNPLKFFKGKSSNNVIDSKNSLLGFLQSKGESVSTCKSLDCCGVHLNQNALENIVNGYSKRLCFSSHIPIPVFQYNRMIQLQEPAFIKGHQ